jgi:N-methylhydantoinase A
MTWRIGSDIGGTFTDTLLVDPESGRARVEKRLTVADRPERGVLDSIEAGLRGAAVPPADVSQVVHGTTLFANTLIQRTGAATALVATAGFADLIEIRNEQRFDVYDLFSTFPDPLIDAARRFEARERMLADGTVHVPLDPQHAREVAAAVRASGVAAVAICFLHAHVNPSHERLMADVLAEVAPGVLVTLSSEVAPRTGEYERLSTTVANAYVQPRAHEYLRALESGLHAAGVAAPLHLMLSDGGSTPVPSAASHPIRLVESGPAAGITAVESIGRVLGDGELVAFDMGGTTAKIAVLTGGQALRHWDLEVCRTHRFKKGSGLPLLVPSVDLVEIGAGGGSIAHFDALRLLRIGPQSAESNPGPACYGRGGRLPTVTDAAAVLGYLNPAYFLGGKMPLDVERARAAIAEHVATPHQWTVEDAALAIMRTATSQMAEATRVHLAERGLDPRRFSLVAFGGAGPLHAADVASAARLRRVIIPPMAGVLSALGLLRAPLSFGASRGVSQPLDGVDLGALMAACDALAAGAARMLPDSNQAARLEYALDMKYAGQKRALEVPLERAWLDAGDVSALRQRFEQLYALYYGRVNPNLPIVIENAKARASQPASLSSAPVPRSSGGPRRKGARRAAFATAPDGVECPVFDRDALPAGFAEKGPALLEEPETTIVVRPEDRFAIDEHGNVVIAIAGRMP